MRYSESMTYLRTRFHKIFRLFGLVLAVLFFAFSVNLAQPHQVQARAYTVCDVDINQDGLVNISDFSLIAINYFRTTPNLITPRVDITGDGTVGVEEYSLLVRFFGQRCEPPLTFDTNHRIMTIGFNLADGGGNAADRYYQSAMGGTAAVAEARVWAETKQHFEKVTHNTFSFEIVKQLQISQMQPYSDGFNFSVESYAKCVQGNAQFDGSWCESHKQLFDYKNWIESNNLCQIINENDIDEVWMLSLPFVMQYENFMVGPTDGFDVNGPGVKVSECNKHVVFINGTYDRPTNLLHNMGHRIERTMQYITSNWSESDRNRAWGNFAATQMYDGSVPNQPYCGNGHYPANTAQAYQYDSSATRTTNCGDWKNFPDFVGTQTQISCSDWGCSDPGWQEYWLSALPHSEGQAVLANKDGKLFYMPKNWWLVLLRPDFAIQLKPTM